jgi:CHAD domain-containing protein
MREIELKLAVHGSFVVPDLASDDLGISLVEELPQLDMRTTYHDADDLRLARSGITLRHRVGEDGGPRWTLKLPVPGEDGTAHDEFHFAGPGTRVPEGARRLATAFVRSAVLVAVASVRTRRNRWLLKDSEGSELAEVVDDEVSVYEGRRVVARFREVEIEGRRIPRDGLEGISKLLQSAGAMAAEPIPKVVRALGAKATGPPDVLAEEGVAPADPAGQAVRAALARSLARLILHDPVTRIGDDTEGVHQMRVAARRMRSDLRTFAPLLESEWAESLVGDLKWLGSVLGDVRDVDVLQVRMREVAGKLASELGPLWEELQARHDAARHALMAALESDRYVGVLDRLVAAVHAPSFTTLAEKSCEDQLPPLVAKPWRKLAKKGRALKKNSGDEAYHEVRIRAKRARYAAEAVAPALPADVSKAAKKFAARCEKVQDVLGHLQDGVVGRRVLEHVAAAYENSGALNLSLGRMIERESTSGLRTKKEFPDVWASLDKNKHLGWLSE